jgi:adenine-specific DNA-methyltransferase
MTLKRKPLLEHTIVRSDNLAFMQDNAPKLREQVDFIYIDPPTVVKPYHNTGKIPTRRQHEKWVEFMRPRLEASRLTLKDTGVIAVTSYDNEQARMRLLLDEAYGEQNFIGMITIDTGNVINNARFLSSSHEYLFLYAKNLSTLTKSGVKWRKKREGLESLRKQEKKLRSMHNENYETISEELKQWLKNQNVPQRLKQFYNVDKKGLYTYSDLSAPKNGLKYEVINPNTGQPVAVPSRGWGVSAETLQELIATDSIIWGANDEHQPLKKLYLKDTPDQVIRSVFSFPSRSSERLLQKILGPDVEYQNIKEVEYVKYIIDVFTPENALVFDFFAGSGTTGHAVLDLNYEDSNSQRRFLLCSNDEGGVYSHILKPRLEAIISGHWHDRQHRPRKAALKTKF